MKDSIQEVIRGQWSSIAPEIRPSAAKNADGTIKPLYLTRLFEYFPGDRFSLQVITYFDPYGQTALANMNIRGHMVWGEDHPIAMGAKKVDFIADEEYSVTPLVKAFADGLNQIASNGFARWEAGTTQSILKKAFPPFGLSDDQIFSEYDLIYIFNDLMFWGARNVDGRGFDKQENRPTNLQIPMIRKR